MGVLIGDKRTRYFNGEKYVFERVRKGEWICISQGSAIIPAQVIASLGD